MDFDISVDINAKISISIDNYNEPLFIDTAIINSKLDLIPFKNFDLTVLSYYIQATTYNINAEQITVPNGTFIANINFQVDSSLLPEKHR